MTTATHDLPVPAHGAFRRRLRLADPSMILWLLLIAVLVFLIASPMVRLVISSFQEPETGRLTLANYAEAYGRARHLQALWNTLQFGAGVAVLACLFGVPLAWAISRTDMPAKGFIRLMVFGAFIIPPYLGAIGWILLAGPNAGWLNKVWMALTGAEHGIFNVYSMTGLIVVVAVTSFPYVFVFTSSALDLVSSEMEDAANILGAGTLRTTLRVTLPLVLPAIVGGLIISFLEAIALFGAPALIALPARFHVVSTQLWQFFEYPVRVEQAAAYAMPLLLITLLMFWLQRSVLGRRGYTTVSGKGGERRITQLGPWRWVMLGYALFVCALAVFLPMLVLTQAAFSKAWGRGFSLDNLSLQELPLHPVRADAGAERDHQHVRLFRHHGVRRHRPLARHRLCGDAQAGAVEQRAGLPLHGAVRHPRHRAGDRLLCRLCAAAARALRHRDDPDPRPTPRASCRSPTRRARPACAASIPRWRRPCASSAAGA